MTKYLIIVALVALATYGSVEAWPLIAGPSIVIDSPADNSAFPGGVVSIRGRAARAARLSLNGAPLLRDRQGNLSTALALPEGGSWLAFAATDRFGREARVARAVYVPATDARMEQATTTNH